MSSSGNRKASDTNRRFLWDTDNEGESTSGASGRSRTTQRSGFSTRDFVVDQSVNLMDLGSTADHRPQQQNRESNRLSLSLAGIFKESMEVENLSRFDDYGDAAPMADAEEYIDNDKRRRGNAALKNVRAVVCSKYGLTLVVALIGAVLVILTMVQVENEERSIHNGVGVQSKNGTSSIVAGTPTAKEKDFNKRRADNIRSRIAERTSSLAALDIPSSPQHKALNWLVRDDKANLPHDHEALLDRYGLAVLWYSSTNSATTSLRGGWTKSDHWMTGSGICAWHGIECVPKHQTATSDNDFTPYTKSYDDNARVTGIILPENNVAGSLPDELRVMDELLILDLEHNKLEGTLPESLSPKLRDLLLGDNKLGGTLPASYSALHALHQLNLGHNAFEGSIPGEWSDRLTKLRYVSLAKNKLTGTSFPEFSKMTRMTGLYLEDNLLEGTLPDWIGGLTGLLDLRIGNNRFGGSIGALTSLQNLETLYLHNNAFTGTIPDMFDHLYRLHELVLHNNGFEGTIPRTLTHLQMLRTLKLGHNQLDGTLPPGLGLLTDVYTISLEHNRFEGSIPTLLGKLDDVYDLTLEHNALTGTIPSELSLCFRLQKLLLQNNALTGSIPSELGSLTGVTALRLESNRLADEAAMPPQVCALRKEEGLTVLCADPEVACDCCTEIPKPKPKHHRD